MGAWMGIWSWAFVVVLGLVVGCGHETRGGALPSGSDAGGGAGSVPTAEGCDSGADRDGDGIADAAEGSGDRDGDGTPNVEDTDSDGDGISDAEEHAGFLACALPDSDEDGFPDWLDRDADNDGLDDAEERELGTDPRVIDTDGDGVTDLGEVRGTGTDPLDPSSTIDPGDFFVVLPYLADREQRTLSFSTSIKIADVYFLVDTTGSMQEAINNVSSSLSNIAAEIAGSIPDVQMGVGHFDDFPFEEPGDLFDLNREYYGDPNDRAYEHLQDITPDLSRVQGALGGLRAGGGADGPESHVEALYQTATGAGGTWSYEGDTFHIAPRTCEPVPDQPLIRMGYPCFRPGALPVVVVVSDASWHNGPASANAYDPFAPPAHTFDQAATALASIGARFVGVSVGGGGRSEASEMGRRTGTVDESGQALVYDASNGTVSSNIVDGIASIAGGVRQDVGSRAENVDGNPDGLDATTFIKSVTPVEGYQDGAPGSGYESKDDRSFYSVIPGTRVEFEVDFWNDLRPPADVAQIFRARIIVVGNRVTDLDARDVYVIVPPDGAIVLI